MLCSFVVSNLAVLETGNGKFWSKRGLAVAVTDALGFELATLVSGYWKEGNLKARAGTAEYSDKKASE